jgi:molecular chaperone GrpE
MAQDDENGQPGTDEQPEPAPEPAPDAGEGRAAGADQPQEPDLGLSDNLKKALAEAEAALSAPAEAADRETAGPPDQDGGAAAEGGPQFDPNRAPQTAEPPPPPSPREMELKMQILDLRQKCRGVEQEIEKKVKEIKINHDQAQHIQKQFDSYKSRVMKEKADWFNYGHEPVIKEILPVLDNLERALAHAGEAADPSAIAEGVALILRQFQAVLEKFAVKPLDPAGECFNPEFHQAMMQVEDDKVPPNTVVQVSQKGYMLKDRLLRPAMVAVSKRSDAASPQAAAACPEEQADTGAGPAEDRHEDGA